MKLKHVLLTHFSFLLITEAIDPSFTACFL